MANKTALVRCPFNKAPCAVTFVNQGLYFSVRGITCSRGNMQRIVQESLGQVLFLG